MTTESSEERDYFTDRSILRDPYEYFEEVRSNGPVHQLKDRDIMVVTGFEEAVEILRNTEDFSAVITTGGPVAALPFKPEGDDISAQIEAYRNQIAVPPMLVTYDGAKHAASRSILNRLFVPSRLKANEAFMRAFADQLVSEAVAKGKCELIGQIATPYVTLVVADLLGVPEDDRNKFRAVIDAGVPPGNMDDAEHRRASPALEFMAGFFAHYIAERRAHPRDDVLNELASATYPDGSIPDLMEVVMLAMFLFAAGQDTSAKLLGNSMRFITETPGLQQKLRADPALIAPFLEEVLRLEGSTKATFRLARRKTKVGGTEIPAGKKIVVALAAANRDPRRWESPKEFKIGRDKIKEHLAFGRGAHVCVGAPLARVEIRVILERFFEQTSHISLSEEKHGPPGKRRLDYEPSYIVRGLDQLHIELKPSRIS